MPPIPPETVPEAILNTPKLLPVKVPAALEN